jgi:hypothetical protein
MSGPDDRWNCKPAALRKEGDLWGKQSPKMGQISTDGSFLRFNNEEGGLLAFMFVPSYHKAVTMIVDRCSEAEDRMTEIKDRLGQLASFCQAREERTVHSIRKAAEPAR